MKKTVLISTILTFALLVGCSKWDNTNQRSTGDVELVFALSTSQPTQELLAQSTKATPEYLPEGTTFSVLVFNAGDPVATATPIASGNYRTTNNLGAATPVTEMDRINLFRGTFDIYIYSPAETNYKAIKVGSDIDFATKVLNGEAVTPQADGRYVVSAELARLNTKLDVKIVAGEFYKNLSIGAKGLTFTGVSASADYVLGGAGYTNVGAATSSITIKADQFKNIDPLAISTESGIGAITIPGTYTLKVSMDVNLDGVVREMSAELPQGTVFEAGKKHLVTIAINNKGLVDAVNVEVKPWSDGGVGGSTDGEFSPTIDYTAMAANCYPVYPIQGKYIPMQFNALKKPVAKYVRGSNTIVNAKGSNPSTAPIDAALSDDIVYQSGDQLEVIWQTAVNHQTSGSMVIQSVNLATDGVATVEVNGPGNAVIAYKRGSTILWNYHIWATDSDPFMTHITTSADVNGTAVGGAAAQFMDRNLGALAATNAKPTTANAYKYFGLVYQHGHTAPFTGQGAGTTSNVYTYIFDGAGNQITPGTIGGYIQSSTSITNVTNTIQNPTTYNCYSNSGYQWITIDISMWSDYGTNKSIYDPCPYGYRVPKHGSWSGFTGATWTNGAVDGGVLRDGTWWSAGGIRWGDSDRGKIAGVGDNCFYWTSTYSSVNRSYGVYFSYSGTVVISLRERSTSYAVRCVQEGY